MADAVNNSFEIERRFIQLKYNTNMPDETILGYDSDPNAVTNGANGGETLIYNVAMGASFLQSTGALWFKSGLPNTWIEIGGSTTVASNVVTKTIAPGATELFYTLDLANNQTFEFIVDTVHGTDRSLTKMSALWADPDFEQNEYSFLGHNIHSDVVALENGGNCLFNITNNEAESITVSVKVEAFAAL